MSKKKKQSPEQKDIHLEAPSEANRDKHINFLKEEEEDNEDVLRIDLDSQENEKRRKEWEEGIEAGKRKNEEKD